MQSALAEQHFKIIIVDENLTFRNSLATRLRLVGYAVEFATGGFHLLHILEKQRDLSLIIIHEDMLDMPAVEIISLIRLSKEKAELPILFISNNEDEGEIFDMVLKGANEYIVKSSNIQPIVDRARKYFTLLKNS